MTSPGTDNRLGNLEFRWANQTDLPLVSEFLQRGFGPGSVQALPGRCHWLYFSHPHGLHISLCTSPTAGLVAACGHLPQTFRIAGQDIPACLGIDFMVAPAWRRRGIGRRFLAMRLERFALSLSVGQSPSMSGLYRTSHAVDMGGFQVGYHRRTPSRSLRLRTFARESLTWAHGFSGVAPASGSWLATCDDQITPWQKWRYGEGPYNDYHSMCHEPTGSIVVSRCKGSVRCIVDYLGPQDERPAILAANVRDNSCSEAQILFSGEQLAADCRRAGFYLRSHDARLVAATSSDGLRKDLKPGQLDIFAGTGDADLLRYPTPVGPAKGWET